MIRLLSMAFLLVFLAGPAWANCKSKDIKGPYVAFFNYPSGKKPVDICGIALSGQGKVTSASTQCINDSITGGRLNLTKNCIITGTIKTDGKDIGITVAVMDQGKDSFTGVFEQGNRGGTFTAVKLPATSGAPATLAQLLGN